MAASDCDTNIQQYQMILSAGFGEPPAGDGEEIGISSIDLKVAQLIPGWGGKQVKLDGFVTSSHLVYSVLGRGAAVVGPSQMYTALYNRQGRNVGLAVWNPTAAEKGIALFGRGSLGFLPVGSTYSAGQGITFPTWFSNLNVFHGTTRVGGGAVDQSFLSERSAQLYSWVRAVVENYSPQNLTFDLPGITKVADAMLSDPSCKTFAETLLNQLSGGKGGSLIDVFNAFFDQQKPHDLFTRAKPDGSLGEATALGRLKDSTATVFLAIQENSQTWIDADNLVQELFHFARPGGGIYSDEQLARALRNTPYATDESKAFPDGTANIFDKRYDPGSPKPWTKATGYSVYFHSIAHLYCGDRNRAGIPRRNGP